MVLASIHDVQAHISSNTLHPRLTNASDMKGNSSAYYHLPSITLPAFSHDSGEWVWRRCKWCIQIDRMRAKESSMLTFIHYHCWPIQIVVNGELEGE